MTNDDIKQLDKLIKKNLNGVATKKDLTSAETRLRREMATKENLEQLRAEMASKKDLTSGLTNLESRLRAEMATKTDLEQLRQTMATKTDLTSVESRLHTEMATKADITDLKQELKTDIEDAVAQISDAVDKSISPLVRRVERIEEHLELPRL